MFGKKFETLFAEVCEAAEGKSGVDRQIADMIRNGGAKGVYEWHALYQAEVPLPQTITAAMEKQYLSPDAQAIRWLIEKNPQLKQLIDHKNSLRGMEIEGKNVTRMYDDFIRKVVYGRQYGG